MVQVSYPGVYIEEFAPGAPIEGVGTSTAAFIGAATSGPINVPVKTTSWDHFTQRYGTEPIPGRFLWYAVRGFFENGGQVCYIVRASNGRNAAATIIDAGATPQPVATVRARHPGVPNPAITIAIAASTVPTLNVYQPTGAYTVASAQTLTFATASEAARFRPGDVVTLGGSQTFRILQAGSGTLRLDSNIGLAVGSTGTIKLADATEQTRGFRLAPTAALATDAIAPGSMLTITQGPISETLLVDQVQIENLATTGADPKTTYRVTFRKPVTKLFSMAAAASTTLHEFDVTITQGAAIVLKNLSLDPAHPRYFITEVNAANAPVVVELAQPPSTNPMPDNLPAVATTTLDSTSGGADENLLTIGDVEYLAAIDMLAAVDDVNLIAVPDSQSASVQQAVITHCERLADRFAVLDSEPGLQPFNDGTTKGVDEQRAGVSSERGYASLYYPWLHVMPFGAGPPTLVPPSGHICGIIARSDDRRGVHKAPANEFVAGALGVALQLSDIDHGQLNPLGINVIRVFQAGGRPMVWGARTTATNTNWRYTSTRRLFLYLEESIQEGIRWAVFEPNNLQLWQKLKRTITEFLARAWRDGALFGEKQEDAFYVRIDEKLNPFSEQALGRLYIEIALRPTYPTEFIVVRIGIWPGGSEVSES